MRPLLIALTRLLRSAALWAAGASVVTATLSALGRAFCLPVPALLPSAGIHLLVTGLRRLERPRTAVGALAGAGAWIGLARRLEPGYLDFILGGYAIAVGAIVAAGIGGWKSPPDSGVPGR